MRLNELWDINFSLIDGKHGWVRGNVLGGMFNNSGRNVIVLDPTLKIDEVDFAYKSFIIEFSGLIIKRIVRDKGWTIVRASNYLKSKFKYDDYIYSIIQDIVKEEEPKIIINRNPTLNVGSILLMKIRKVKPDAEDYTLSIPSAILPGQHI